MAPDQPHSAPDMPGDDAAPRERGAAVAQLFQQHNRVLIGFLAARLQSEHEAQEVAQEAYVKLLQLERSDAVGFLRAYLFRVAENLALDRLKHRRHVVRHQRVALLADAFAQPSSEDEAVAREELQLLNTVLAELPPNAKAAFQLHRFEGLSTAQIAVQVGVSERMVRKYIARALAYARLRLEGVSAEDAQERCQS